MTKINSIGDWQAYFEITDYDSPVFLMTVELLAEVLNLSVRSVWRHSKKGMIPGRVQLGGSVRWRSDVIGKWINAGCPSQKETKQQGE
tara:strand:- start:65 stop:328 length:264 start_codon:yes stop_codon:yes gene_type:complete